MITVLDIQHRVAASYGLRMTEMTSRRQSKAVARPRQIAMYLARELTPCSLPEIGRRFGGRDHTTVMHAVTRVQDLIAIDPEFGDSVARVRADLETEIEYV